MSCKRLSGLNPVLPARSKRSMAFFTALKNAGAAIGYLPFSRVNGSPSTRKVRRLDSAATPILGACDLYFSLMKRSNTQSGSIRCASTSTILNPSFICVSSQYGFPSVCRLIWNNERLGSLARAQQLERLDAVRDIISMRHHRAQVNRSRTDQRDRAPPGLGRAHPRVDGFDAVEEERA